MQRAIWIVTFLIILAGAYYWVVIHEGDVSSVSMISDKLELQTDNINTITEEQNRLELRYIGHGKHLKTMQDEFKAHYTAYNKKMELLDADIIRVNNSINDLGEQLNSRINDVNVEIEDMRDEYDAQFNSNRRKIGDLERSAENMEQDISEIKALLIIVKEKLEIEE